MGKSALTQLINRTYDVCAGRVLIDGWMCASGTWIAALADRQDRTGCVLLRTLGENIALALPMQPRRSSRPRAKPKRTILSRRSPMATTVVASAA
jgi:ATP-binding cassette subfamily B protein